ncbi:hypothetical protein [Siminovitchia fortis]|nr:hypothetical protein [Siminovitchia fortis]
MLLKANYAFFSTRLMLVGAEQGASAFLYTKKPAYLSELLYQYTIT